MYRFVLLAITLISTSSCSTVTRMTGGDNPPLTPAEEGAVRAAAECEVVAITFGSEVPGTLSAGDCVREGSFRSSSELTDNQLSGDHNTDYYGFRYNYPDEFINIYTESEDVDTHIVLYDKFGNVIEADDDSGEGTNALISRKIPEGVYIVGVSSSRPNEQGDYILHVSYQRNRVLRAIGR